MEYPRGGPMEISREEADRLKEDLGGITDGRRQSGHLLHKLGDVPVYPPGRGEHDGGPSLLPHRPVISRAGGGGHIRGH
jgi:hypothetical protein